LELNEENLECSAEDWIGVFVYDSDCESDGGSTVVEVDENGSPINEVVIEDVTFTAGLDEGTIDFGGLSVPVEGCTLSLDQFGLYELAGNVLTIDFGDGDCKIFRKQ